MNLIEFKNLTIGYHKPVVSNLNLKIAAGDFVCLVGPNGAGKSTLVKTIIDLIKPLKGEIIFTDCAKKHIGFLPQENELDSHFPAKVKEIVLTGCLNQLGWRPFYTAKNRSDLMEKLRLLNISNLAEKTFTELSGGQKQKVLLARALMASDQLLILDEPFNHLDLKSIKELYQTLTKLNQKGMTIVLVTHDLDHGNLIGNKILSLRDEVFYGTTDEFVRKVHHE